MPHSRAHSWAYTPRPSLDPSSRLVHHQAATSWCTNNNNILNVKSDDAKGGGENYYFHARTRSIPAITDEADYLPLPYARSRQQPEKKRPQSMIASSPSQSKTSFGGRDNNPGSRNMHRPSPLPLSLLPCLPSAVYNSRHELLRRPSPTSLSFRSSTPPLSPLPPLSPATPMTPSSMHSFSTMHEPESQYYAPRLGGADGETKYVLTLKTSADLDQQMQMLRQKWFPADRLKVPAHVTLFHALPESKLSQASSLIESLSGRIPRFEISTGRITKSRTGVLVALEIGENEVRRLFVSLRTAWWEWLSDQDKHLRAHWTVQNKEEDSRRVDEAFRDTHRLGTGMGWALGLVLWRYERDGRWTKEREFDFARSGRERVEMEMERDRLPQESDGWPVF